MKFTNLLEENFNRLVQEPAIIKASIHQDFAKGDMLLRQGHKSPGLMIIKKGNCEVFNIIPGEEKTIYLGELNAGELIGYISFIDGSVVTASVRAISNMTIVIIPREVLIGLSHLEPHKAIILLEPIVQHICRLTRESIQQIYDEKLKLPGLESSHAYFKKKLTPISSANQEYKLIQEKNLSHLPFFKVLHQYHLPLLLPVLTFYTSEKNQIIYEEKDKEQVIYYVISGALETYVMTNNLASKLTIAGPGSAVGLVNFLDKKGTMTACVTREDAIILKIDEQAIKNIERISTLSKDKILLQLYKELTVSFNRFKMHYLRAKSVVHIYSMED